MKKFLPAILSGVMAVSFSTLAAAAGADVDVKGSANTGANIDLDKKGDASVTDKGSVSASDKMTGQEKSTESSSAGASSTKQDDDATVRDNNGKHKGWKNNKHRDESSGRYEGSTTK